MVIDCFGKKKCTMNTLFEELQEGVQAVAKWYRTEASNPEINPNLIVSAQIKLTSYISTIAAQEVAAKREATQSKLNYEFEHFSSVSKVKKDLQCSNAEAERVSELETFELKRVYKELEDDHHAWRTLYASSKVFWEQLRSHLSYIKEQLGNE